MTNEQKHTPGPWIAESRGVSDGALVVKDAEFNEICVVRERAQRSYGPQDYIDQANAARIVACVNACEGMADPADEIAKLRAEVDRLKHRLSDVLEGLEGMTLPGAMPARIEKARALL